MTMKKRARSALALLIAVVLCVGMVPSAFAAQQDSYHDPADHWQEANNRTNELDANATVTIETFIVVNAHDPERTAASVARPHPLRCSGRLSTLGTARPP